LTGLPPWLWLLGGKAATVVGILTLRLRYGAVLVLVAILCLSGFHYALRYQQVGPHHLKHLAERSTRFDIYGRVVDWPLLRADRTEITIEPDSLVADRCYRPDGLLLLKVTDTTTAVQRGDRLAFTARVYPVRPTPSSAGFDYGRYLNLKGIYGVSYLPTLLTVRVDRRGAVGYFAFIDAIRDYIIDVFTSDLTPTAAALAKGYLLGETRDIPPDIYAMFRDSGTLHLLAVSGSNVALVLLFVHLLIRPLRLQRTTRHAVLLAVIVVYAGLCYFEPSVMRASLMAALVILARIAQRKVNLNQIIALTAAIILLIDPGEFFGIGFQLSFATAWGLIFITPRVAAQFERYHTRRWYRWLVFPLIIALIAQIVSTPLVALYFERFPLYSVPANLIVVPLVSIGVVGVLALPLVHLVWPMLGLLAGSLVDPVVRAAVFALQWFGGTDLPVVELTGHIGERWLLALTLFAYSAMIIATLAITSKRARRTLVFFTIGIAVSALTLVAFLPGKSDGATVHIERLPGGVVTLVTQPDGCADVIVTSLVGRPYPIDERVITPILTRAGVDTVRTVSVLQADYAAIDDVVRLAHAWNAGQLLIPSDMRAAVSSVMRQFSEDSVSLCSLVVFGDETSAPEQAGLSLGRLGACLATPGRIVLVCEKLQPAHLRPGADQRDRVLVVGRTWTPAAEDWIRLRTAGYSLIVAASIRPNQALSDDLAQQLSAESLPDYLHDLKRMGPLRLSSIDRNRPSR
ncbi:DUF4131 domain-containing protein, partial [candidate division GN15 bacterium]|nr:DUF4131 domain-containing protein [candidate division GN15 bacterium]